MSSSSRTSFSFSRAEFAVAVLGFLVLSPGGMPVTQTVRGGVIPDMRSRAAKPLWRRGGSCGAPKVGNATFNSTAQLLVFRGYVASV